jgi:hypothetical protein
MENLDRRPGITLLTVFYVSLMAICAELCLALMLSLKAYSHMVYVVISFALLGYGLGSNLTFILGERLKRVAPDVACGTSLCLISVLTAAAAHLLPHLPINLDLIYSWGTILSLTLVYATVALPFTGIGFLIAILFSAHPGESRRLYFWDLLGAGMGALVFFPLIGACGPLRALLLLSFVALVPALLYIRFHTRARRAVSVGILALAAAEGSAAWLPEPVYAVDRSIGWEWIPGYFKPQEFDQAWRKWHPLGRTDLHRMKEIKSRRKLVSNVGPITFELPVDPAPEFCYFTNCYRAGTPVFDLSPESLKKNGSVVTPFSQVIETPYVVLDKPRVLVIGAGGGRDLFVARVHQAAEVIAAEINPATFAAMSPGGAVYDYSGRVYTAQGTQVHNIDGRHLVKNRPSGSHDLIILNGIDTFAALSTGAYAFAENYLYTRDAIVDYLRILDANGVMNFNRWFEGEQQPRETLRLFVMVLEALRATGAPDPAKHVLVGSAQSWGIVLAKKSPFTAGEEAKLLEYFRQHHMTPVWSPGMIKPAEQINPFDQVVSAYRQGKEKEFIEGYWADISVVRDDNPFFYKYYKFRLEDTRDFLHPAGGLTAFYVQAFIVVQTLIFILLFILLPLFMTRKKAAPILPREVRSPFLAYFALLGAGFIFIEITLMQRFTLALGSPIYSISVTLATILVATGAGSLLSGKFLRLAGTEARMIRILSLFVVVYLVAMVTGGTWLLNLLVRWPFAVRVILSSAILAPMGLCLGVFFPTGLLLVGRRSPEAVAWAWGINSGFTVLGSTLTIVIAQFLGFNTVLLIAAALYLAVPFAYGRLSRGLDPAALLK